MGRKPGPLNASERREKARQAYQLAIRRVTYTEISDHLDISRNLVSTLVQEEQERQWQDRDGTEIEAEKRRAISTYEEVIRGAWQRLGRIRDNSLNVSGLFNVIVSAQSRIDGITGIATVGLGDDMANKARAYLDLMDAIERDAKDLSE